MKILIFILSFSFFGCETHDYFCTNPDGNGLCISGPSGTIPSEKEVHALLSILDEQLLIDYPQEDGVRDMLDDISIQVEIITTPLYNKCDKMPGSNSVFTCAYPIGGANVGGILIYLAYNECLGYSSLAHELLHSWERFVLGIEPPLSHSTDFLWDHGGDMQCNESVECRTKEAFNSGFGKGC